MFRVPNHFLIHHFQCLYKQCKKKQDSDKCEEILLVSVFVCLMPDNWNQQDFLLINPEVSQGAISSDSRTDGPVR